MEEETEEELHLDEAITTIPRRKVSMRLIEEFSLRKACYKKRRAGLLKKMYEITTLCHIDACAVIYGPGDTTPTMWPSPEVATKLIQKFQNTPETERFRRTINHHVYMEEKNKRMQRQLIKLREEIEQKEMSIFMHEIYIEGKPLSEFAVNDLRRLLRYVEEKLRIVRMRISHFEQQKLLPPNNNDQPPAPLPISCPQDKRVQDDIESWFNLDELVLEQDSALNLVNDSANQNNNSGLELIPTNTFWGGDDNASGFNYDSDLMVSPQSNFGGLVGGSDSNVLSHGNFGGFNGEISDLGFFSAQGNFFGDLNGEIDDLMVLPQGNFSAPNNVENNSMGVPHNNVNFGGVNGEENLGLLNGSSMSEIGGSSTWMPYGHIGNTTGDNGMGIEQHNENYGGPINITELQQCHPTSNFGANNGEAAMGKFNANFASSSSGRNFNNELVTHENFASSSAETSALGMPISSFEGNFP